MPAKKSERRKRLQQVTSIPATLVFYETPHRIADSLQDCLEILGNRQASVVRELTKLYEQVLRGELQDLANKLSEKEVRGEIVLVIDRVRENVQIPTQKSLTERVLELENEGLDNRGALKQAAREFGLARSEAYRRFVQEQNK